MYVEAGWGRVGGVDGLDELALLDGMARTGQLDWCAGVRRTSGLQQALQRRLAWVSGKSDGLFETFFFSLSLCPIRCFPSFPYGCATHCVPLFAVSFQSSFGFPCGECFLPFLSQLTTWQTGKLIISARL